MSTNKQFSSLKEFYPFYLKEHKNHTSRALHFIGTFLIFAILIFGSIKKEFTFFYFCPLVGYGFAWVGHYFFEKNKPATFKHPFYSLASDFLLFFDILRGKEKIQEFSDFLLCRSLTIRLNSLLICPAMEVFSFALLKR